MTPRRTIELSIYTLVIILVLIALLFAAVAPGYFTDNNVVYQGF